MKTIGVMKSATQEFPIAHLPAHEFGERGSRYGIVSNNEKIAFAGVGIE
jgi:hypothetical protein